MKNIGLNSNTTLKVSIPCHAESTSHQQSQCVVVILLPRPMVCDWFPVSGEN